MNMMNINGICILYSTIVILIYTMVNMVDGKSAVLLNKPTINTTVFTENPCDEDMVKEVCTTVPVYDITEYQILTSKAHDPKLLERLKQLIIQCDEPNGTAVTLDEFMGHVMSQFNAMVERAELEHNNRAHALHLYMRTAGFLKVTLGVDYLYKLTTDEIQGLDEKRERVVLRAVAEPACTRPDLLKGMGLNELEAENVLRHDELMTSALGNVTGLEAVVYRQFAPYFDEFGRNVSFRPAKRFEPLFADVLTEHTPAAGVMMRLREQYAKWHLECVAREAAERRHAAAHAANGTTAARAACRDALPDLLDRLRAAQLFDSALKRRSILHRLDVLLEYTKRAVRAKLLQLRQSKQTESKQLAALQKLRVELRHVSRFDEQAALARQLAEADAPTLSLSLGVRDVLAAAEHGTIALRVAHLRHWRWSEGLDDPTVFGALGPVLARLVWSRLNETEPIDWRSVLALDEEQGNHVEDYQLEQIAILTALRAMQYAAYETELQLDAHSAFSPDQLFAIAYLVEHQCEANASVDLFNGIYADSFNCVAPNVVEFVAPQEELKLGSPFATLHLRQPQVEAGVLDELGAFSEANLDNSVNPCDDFYQFACGKSTQNIFQVTYNRNIRLIEAELSRNISDSDPNAIRFLKRTFQKCLRDELRDAPFSAAELEAVMRDVRAVTGLREVPVRPGDFAAADFLRVFGALAGYLHSQFNIGPYKFYTAKRTGVHDHVQAKILTLPPADFAPDQRAEAWVNFFDTTNRTVDGDQIDSLVWEGIFLRNMSFQEDLDNRIGPSEGLVSSRVDDLDFYQVGLNLTAFLIASIGRALPAAETVLISPGLNYSRLLAEPRLQVAALNGLFEELFLEVLKEDIPANGVCYGVMETAGEFLLGRVLLNAKFTFHGAPTEAEQRAGKIAFRDFQSRLQEYAEHVFVAMKNVLHETPWLSEPTLRRALQRVDNLTMILGNDPLLMDRAIEEIYGRVRFDENHVIKKQYAHNVMPIRRAEYGCCTLSLLPYSPVMSFLIHLLETTRTIVFPANALFWPMYDHGHPAEYVFGFFGASVAHEVGHMFDGRSLLPREFAEDPAWMGRAERRAYARMAACAADQYDRLCDGAECADGVQSNIEIMADNIGLQLAYRALLSWTSAYGSSQRPDGRLVPRLTSQQLFFLNFVQYMCEPTGRGRVAEKPFRAHPRVDFRVQGMLMNMPAFADAFNCPRGSRYWMEEADGGTCPIFNGELKERPPGRLEKIWEEAGVLNDQSESR